VALVDAEYGRSPLGVITREEDRDAEAVETGDTGLTPVVVAAAAVPSWSIEEENSSDCDWELREGMVIAAGRRTRSDGERSAAGGVLCNDAGAAASAALATAGAVVAAAAALPPPNPEPANDAGVVVVGGAADVSSELENIEVEDNEELRMGGDASGSDPLRLPSAACSVAAALSECSLSRAAATISSPDWGCPRDDGNSSTVAICKQGEEEK
jgi:hypothetical protein